MLAHPPRLPLIIDYIDQGRGVTADEEEGIVLALQQRDRVRRIRLMMPVPELQRLIMAMDGEFPILEHLYIGAPTKHTTGLILRETFQAHLRHFILINFAFSVGSPLLTNTTAAALVSLVLQRIHPSAYFRPDNLLQQLSLIPHLETFIIGFDSPVHNRNVERRLLRELVMTPITLPNLHRMGFKGASAYLEAVLPHITTPLLERLEISFLNQLIFSITHLLQFIDEAENSNFGSAVLTFHEESLCMNAYPTEGARVYALHLEVGCRHFDWQVASAAQIVNMLRTPFSTVEHLTLEHRGNFKSSEPPNEDDLVQWHELLGPFDNVKTLSVFGGPTRELSFTLTSDRGLPLELSPELKELLCPAGRGASHGHSISTFIDTHQNAERPRLLFHTPPDVLLDGFLAHTFSPQDAPAFFTLLLGTPDFRAHLSYSEGIWYINHVQQPSSGLSTQLPLDFGIRTIEGTVVPQRRWTPADEVSLRLHVHEAALQLPVFFVNRNGGVGFWLRDILEGRDRDLNNRDSQAPLGGVSTTHIRINVSSLSYLAAEGFHPYSLIPFTVARICLLATPDTNTRRDVFAEPHQGWSIHEACRHFGLQVHRCELLACPL